MMEDDYDFESDNRATSDSDNSDSSQSNDSYSSSSSRQNKNKKSSIPKLPIKAIAHILKELADDDTLILQSKSSKRNSRDFFCIEDSLLTKDIKVNVEGMGQINFPLEKETIERLIKLSSKAKFGKGRETLLDTKVRDTQTIPASKLKIELNDSALDELLKRIGTNLNIGKNCKLIPHLHNLLIYGPGQFFKKHTDSEKEQNMIATLVIILPYPHEGGELIIEHNKKKHMVFGSKNPDVTKCVAFYSDCAHEIKKVTDGYRVAITYNIVLQVPDVPVVSESEVNQSLDEAVNKHFKKGYTKLGFGLNHSYSKNSIKWELLKGADRSRANALVAVAKKQGRIPCLALTTITEIYDKENTYYDPRESPVWVEDDASIDFMIDDSGSEVKCSDKDIDFCCGEDFYYTRKAKELFKPFKSEFTGPNEGDTDTHWYRRACVVLWRNKWMYSQGYGEVLSDLHNLTKEEGEKQILKEKINSVRKEIVQPEMYEPKFAEMLVDIVIYLNDKKEAKFILGELCNYLTTTKDNLPRLVQLENLFGNKTWRDIVKVWIGKGYGNYWHDIDKNAPVFIDNGKGYGSYWHDVAKTAPEFIDNYLEAGATPKSVIIESILEEGVNHFITSEKDRGKTNYIYYRKKRESIEKLVKLMKACALLENKTLQGALLQHVIDSSYPVVSLGEVYTELMDILTPEQLTSYKIIRDLALIGIPVKLSELQRNLGWALPVKVSCQCKICSPVLSFFTSETLKKSNVIEGPKKTSDHLYDVFNKNLYSLPCKFNHDQQGRNHKIWFEKMPQLLEDKKKLNEDLLKFKERMEGPQSMSVKVTQEAGTNSSDDPSTELTDSTKSKPKEGLGNNFAEPPSAVEPK